MESTKLEIDENNLLARFSGSSKENNHKLTLIRYKLDVAI